MKPQNVSVTYIEGPKEHLNPAYSDYDTRLVSFAHWPVCMGQTPEAMADAGFFYLGIGDKVKCHSCNGKIHKWAFEDVPWEEHARWFGDCRYVKSRKGEKFVEEMAQRKPTSEPSLSETLSRYREFCRKKIRPTDPRRAPLTDIEKNVLKDCIPSGHINSGVRLDDVVFENLCRYCGERRVGGIYVPCAHAVACYQCAVETTQCDVCGEEVADTKHMVILPDRPYGEYEGIVSPLMMQEANDLTRATIRILQALGKNH